MSHNERTDIQILTDHAKEANRNVQKMGRAMIELVRVSQNAAINEAQRRIDRAQREQTRRINESINSLEESTRRNIEALDRRQREQMSQLTQQVYEDINTVQRRLADRMDQQAKTLQGEIDNLSRSVDRRFDSVEGQIKTLAQGMAEMENDINQHFERNEQEMARMRSDMNNIVKEINARYASEDEQAQAAVQTAIDLMGIVDKRTQLDRFAPGYEAQDIRHRIENLSQSSNHGPALMAQAEEAILQIWQVESHAIQEKAKHDAMVEIALTQVEIVLTFVNKNRVMEQQVEGGEPMEIENEFWSEGEYGQLEQELKELQAELGDRYNRNLTKERIEEINRRSQEIEARIQEIGLESVRKAILSEARVETAEDIVNAMQSKGWTLKGIGTEKPEFNYMGGLVDHDWRQGVCAVLENNLGEEITVIVDPDTDTQNTLILHQETSNSGMTDKDVREQMQMVREQMADLGYQVGESKAGYKHMPQMGSVERLGKAHAAEQIRKQLQQH